MKRTLKLIIILCILFTMPINARQIDMNGAEIKETDVYTSGDILSNVNMQNRRCYYFYALEGKMYYFAHGDEVKSNGYYDIFHIDTFSDDAYPGKLGATTEFIIPTFYGENIFYSLQYDTYNSFKINPNITGKSINFYPSMNIPKVKVECDSEEIRFGETAHCKLLITVGIYIESIKNISDLSIDLDLSSEEFAISNIQKGPITNISVNNNHIRGSVVDKNLINPYLENSEFNYSEEFANDYKDDISYHYTCLDDMMSAVGSSIVGGYIMPEEDQCYYRVDNTVKVATFDITSTKQENQGIINLSDVKVVLNTDEASMEDTVLYRADVDTTAIPIKEKIPEVKGVEENPKTGLFNYLLLIIPVGIFVEGLVLLNKKKNFIKL